MINISFGNDNIYSSLLDALDNFRKNCILCFVEPLVSGILPQLRKIFTLIESSESHADGK
jgi:hypothetical protein